MSAALIAGAKVLTSALFSPKRDVDVEIRFTEDHACVLAEACVRGKAIDDAFGNDNADALRKLVLSLRRNVRREREKVSECAARDRIHLHRLDVAIVLGDAL